MAKKNSKPETKPWSENVDDVSVRRSYSQPDWFLEMPEGAFASARSLEEAGVYESRLKANGVLGALVRRGLMVRGEKRGTFKKV